MNGNWQAKWETEVQKRVLGLTLCLALSASPPALADVVGDLKTSEGIFGIDNADKTAIKKIGILED